MSDTHAANKAPTFREPLFHIARRKPLRQWQGWLVRAGAVLGAFVFCSILAMIVLKAGPFDLIRVMITSAFGTQRRFWKLLQNIAILLCIALAVTPAFKMKFWNIGAEGQVLVGGLASAACMFYLGGKIPEGLLTLLMFVSSVVAGGLWAALPAVCKALWNTNETLFTLMMNYVAIQLIGVFLAIWVPTGSGVLNPIYHGTLPAIAGNQYILNILIVALLTGILYVYLRFSKHGYEISVVGESRNTARYVGINVKKVIIRTVILSGIICGIAGFLLVGGTDYTISKETAGGRGFTAIIVSWMGKFNPLYMILSSFLVVFLEQSADQITTIARTASSFPEIVTGIFFFFIIGCEFFLVYQVKFLRHKHVRVEGVKAPPAAAEAKAEAEIEAEAEALRWEKSDWGESEAFVPEPPSPKDDAATEPVEPKGETEAKKEEEE